MRLKAKRYNADIVKDIQRCEIRYLAQKYFKGKIVLDVCVCVWGEGIRDVELKKLGYSVTVIDCDDTLKNCFMEKGIVFKKCNLEKEKMPFKDIF
jgi:hypothetical protein